MPTYELPISLLTRTGIHQRLSGAGLATMGTIHDELIAAERERLDDGAQPSRIPLIWRALAETVGLIVDNDGRIIDGPKAAVPGLSVPAFALVVEEVA